MKTQQNARFSSEAAAANTISLSKQAMLERMALVPSSPQAVCAPHVNFFTIAETSVPSLFSTASSSFLDSRLASINYAPTKHVLKNAISASSDHHNGLPVHGIKAKRHSSTTASVATSTTTRTTPTTTTSEEERTLSSSGASSTGQTPNAKAEYNPKWSMLLSTEALEDAQISRAGSVTDAHVLRRKGRLKEQDGLIEFIISMHSTHSPLEVMEKMERWTREHLEDPQRSNLKRLVPSIGRVYSHLPLVQALREYDQFSSLSRRKYVPPNFAEVRHVLNIAQVHAIAEDLALITFDADGTLYADGHHIERDNKMIDHIIKLMQHGTHVAIVTAAGYPGEPAKFETRFAGLLAAFEDLCLPQNITSLFHIMGGECNYLLEVNKHYGLDFVPDNLWQSEDMLKWQERDIQLLLSDAECALKSAAARLRVPVDIIKKPRAVGVVPRELTIYEVLEEMALTVQVQLVDAKLPFCAFNGGRDVFVDVGNKSIGLGALMKYLKKRPNETLHVGDRFTLSGNDSATRSKCPILWVANPEETAFYTRMLLRDIQLARLTPYIE